MAEFLLREAFNPKGVQEQAGRLLGAWAGFDRVGFEEAVCPKLAALNFGERAQLIRESLHEFLPQAYPEALAIILKALPPELTRSELLGMDNFIIWPLAQFVSSYGINHFELSMGALYQMTRCFSAEGDIRFFIEKYPQETLARLAEWAKDPNVHVRRLVSEGTRPRLPLCRALPAFKKDPSPILPLLEVLKNDPELYVRRSVANNLNDIAKDNPEVVVALLSRWNQTPSPELDWMTRHALRSLIKKGHAGALALLGYGTLGLVELKSLCLTKPRYRLGEELRFEARLFNPQSRPQRLMVDFVVHYQKAGGKLSPKVFKAAKPTLGPGETLVVSKGVQLEQRSTREHYPGLHKLSLQINGTSMGEVPFILEID
ncbi:MAG: hypothetical protein A2508_03905 [Candidatus Lambdaproteobacteria bacterium RIFOXYD12_FULL_49_8]|uniref:DNA alkylation repair protein n=1 Tax=Candidatus Lambdaproteobacteria bacterium RIFOXYD2_FULL_50_16 TaxID=1817772 RepID=A0A1F6GDP6_9PROT|nr:MAG: hypothetical protein A2527_04455 [Candidatus Lambdaproteobacteria bacterium RIFOXYD2_FULL_50_16]OGG98300.1 MAG: hypothetical protein A2508_03905 [Candidatus Lambdaproteobacteria bacterium RIFOXYD12_FULL_49_8]